MKFDDSIVKKYLLGDDVENIEDLENDEQFMINVLNESKDVKMFEFASLNVKKSPRFTLEALKLCGNDELKMLQVSKYCIESMYNIKQMSIEYKEIIFFIDKYYMFEENLKDAKSKDLTDDDKKLKEQIIDIANKLFKSEIEKVENNKKNKFKLISSNNGNSEIINEYFAKWFIYDIFYDEEDSIEETLKRDVKDLSIINKMGVVEFIMNYIKKQDEKLFNYLLKHMTFLSRVELEVNRIKNKFENLKKMHNVTYNYEDENKEDFNFEIEESSLLNGNNDFKK